MRSVPFSRAPFADEYPFAEHWFQLSGMRMHYVDEGSGPPLLFVHGNPTWSFAWRNLVKGLRDRYRCIAVDHIGCGLSDKPQDHPYTLARHTQHLRQLVEHLDLRGATLIAHDWGGAIGLGAVEQMPDRFNRLVLLNTAAFRSRRIPFRIAVCRWPVIGPLAVRGCNAFARAALRMAVAEPARLSPAVRAGYLAPYDSWAHRVAIQRFVDDIPLTSSHPSYSTLRQLEDGLADLRDKRVLFVWGERDWCFTPAFLEEFVRRFPEAEVLRLPSASHYVFEDAHPQLLARIEQFLASTGNSAPSPG